MARTIGLVLVYLAAAAVLGCGGSPVQPGGLDADSSPAAANGPSGTKGPNRPPAEQLVSAVFRCNDASCAATDRIRGDGASYAAFIDSGGNLRLTPDASRTVTLDYSECLQPCPAGRRWFTTVSPGGVDGLLMHTSVLVPGTESETPRGMLDIPVGATWFSRIKIGFRIVQPSTGANLVWGTRFNPFFQGSTNLQVARVSDTQWHVEATPAQIAFVRSAGETKRDNSPETFEGNYLMPFRIVVTR